MFDKPKDEICSSTRRVFHPSSWMRSVSVQPKIDAGISYLQEVFDSDIGFVGFIAPGGDFGKRRLSPPEIFTTLMICQCLMDAGIHAPFLSRIPKIIRCAVNETGFFHFFMDRDLLVADMDCTAVATSCLRALNQTPPDMLSAIERLVDNIDESGVIEVYEKPSGEHAGRIDACVLVNVLHLLYELSLENRARASEDAVFQTLTKKSYLAGTRYYPSPDAFLYFLSRLVRDYPPAEARFGKLLLAALEERENLESPYLDLALRTAALDNLNIGSKPLRMKVLDHQLADGSWPAGAFFKYGRKDLYFGSEALSTAFGIRAAVSCSIG